MSRGKKRPTRRVQVPIEKLNAIVERTRTEPLPADEHATLKAAAPDPRPSQKCRENDYRR